MLLNVQCSTTNEVYFAMSRNNNQSTSEVLPLLFRFIIAVATNGGFDFKSCEKVNINKKTHKIHAMKKHITYM